jgi:hypothetical protein
VADQDDSRPCGNVGVIGNIDQQPVIRGLIFNPTMKYRDQRLEAGLVAILDEEFHVDVLKLHALGTFFRRAPSRARTRVKVELADGQACAGSEIRL